MTIRQTGDHSFAQVPSADIERSSFNRSHGFKTTMDAGFLVPVFVDEVLPGDTFNLRMQHFARLATPLRPFMDNLFLDTFFFFVPNRLVWKNWVRMNGERDNPTDSVAFTIPQLAAPANGFEVGSLADYFGIPPLVKPFHVNALPFRAYNLIWNTWFRDENLQNSVRVNVFDTGDVATDFKLLRRGKRHDYFTSCLPWPQKGDAVQVSIGGTAAVALKAQTGINSRVVNASDHNPMGEAWDYVIGKNDGNMYHGTGSSTSKVVIDPNGSLYADLSTATPITINALREAFQMQKLSERDARGGTRYIEVVRSHFGVISPDARLQRPEYLGGGSQPINVNPVAQTAPGSTGTTPQGNLAAFVTSSGSSGFVKSFTEHGFIIGLACVRADLNYQQGLNRMWSRSTRYDHYWPALAHLGEQTVKNKEIYLQGDDQVIGSTPINDLVFGYQERYAEYRYKPSLITGQFRTWVSPNLGIWHLAQDFANLPTLSPAFIEEHPPLDRVSAVPSEPMILLDAYFKLTCARPMPVFGVPGLIDHF